VNTHIDSGGILILVPGADDSGVSNSGGTIVNTGVILTSWGYNVDIEGTSASGLLVTGPNDLEYVLAGGTATDSFVTSSGEQDVYLGGLAIGNEVANLAAQYVLGGEVVSTLLGFHGSSFLLSGAIASDTTIQANAFMVVSAATATDTDVQSGGRVFVNSGGSAISSFLAASGYMEVSSGGTATDTTIIGGQAYVSVGGVASDTFISASGALFLYSGGLAIGTSVFANGYQEIFHGGVASDTVLYLSGADYVYSAGSAISTMVNSGGYEVVSVGGFTDFTHVLSGGEQFVASGGSAVSTFVDSGGTQYLYSGAVISDTRVAEGGTIDVSYYSFTGSASVSFNTATDVLTLSQGEGDVFTVQLQGGYAGEYFALRTDGMGGTDITVEGTPCYCRGTLILTDQGEKPVETLTVGDKLVTSTGAARALRWIGRRSYAGIFANGNKNVLPVKFAAGALGDGLPRRDLFVSPLHAMFIEGMLVPAHLLVNGTSIVQVAQMEGVEYFHLELDTHDIILAEGAYSESFVDDGTRAMFHNAAERQPVPTPRPAMYCAPRVEDGHALHHIRRRLAERNSQRLAAA
jgi:autotransporter passenger strand-loop-strand repeat protein